MTTEVRGATLRGMSARTVMRRNSQGSERNKSVADMTAYLTHPPANPAVPPTSAARMAVISAAAGARRSDTLVP
jgi:hypothetical protein